MFVTNLLILAARIRYVKNHRESVWWRRSNFEFLFNWFHACVVLNKPKTFRIFWDAPLLLFYINLTFLRVSKCTWMAISARSLCGSMFRDSVSSRACVLKSMDTVNGCRHGIMLLFIENRAAQDLSHQATTYSKFCCFYVLKINIPYKYLQIYKMVMHSGSA